MTCSCALAVKKPVGRLRQETATGQQNNVLVSTCKQEQPDFARYDRNPKIYGRIQPGCRISVYHGGKAKNTHLVLPFSPEDSPSPNCELMAIKHLRYCGGAALRGYAMLQVQKHPLPALKPLRGGQMIYAKPKSAWHSAEMLRSGYHYSRSGYVPLPGGSVTLAKWGRLPEKGVTTSFSKGHGNSFIHWTVHGKQPSLFYHSAAFPP